MLGSGAVMVFDDTADPLLVAWRIAKFFAHESCGKCTPCREGSGWIEKVLYRMAHGYGRPEDLDLLLGFGNNLAPGSLVAPSAMTTICQLGPSHDVAHREPAQLLVRRDQGTHGPRRRTARATKRSSERRERAAQ